VAVATAVEIAPVAAFASVASIAPFGFVDGDATLPPRPIDGDFQDTTTVAAASYLNHRMTLGIIGVECSCCLRRVSVMSASSTVPVGDEYRCCRPRVLGL
jgi:hypothetical protein